MKWIPLFNVQQDHWSIPSGSYVESLTALNFCALNYRGQPASLSLSQVVWLSQKGSFHCARRSRFRWFKDATELNISPSQKSCHRLSCLANACWQIRVPGTAVRTSNKLIQLLTGSCLMVRSQHSGNESAEMQATSLSLYMKLEMVWRCEHPVVKGTVRWDSTMMTLDCGGAGAHSLSLGLFLCCGNSCRYYSHIYTCAVHWGTYWKAFSIFGCVRAIAIFPSLSSRAWGKGVILTLVHLIKSLFSLFFVWLSLSVHFNVVLVFCWILRYLAGLCGLLDSNCTMFLVGVFCNNLTQFAFLTK